MDDANDQKVGNLGTSGPAASSEGVIECPEQHLQREPLSGRQCYSDGKRKRVRDPQYKRSSVTNAAGVIESPDQHLPREPLSGGQRDSDGKRKRVRDPEGKLSIVINAAGVIESPEQHLPREPLSGRQLDFDEVRKMMPGLQPELHSFRLCSYGEHLPLVNRASVKRDSGVISPPPPKDTDSKKDEGKGGTGCIQMK